MKKKAWFLSLLVIVPSVFALWGPPVTYKVFVPLNTLTRVVDRSKLPGTSINIAKMVVNNGTNDVYFGGSTLSTTNGPLLKANGGAFTIDQEDNNDYYFYCSTTGGTFVGVIAWPRQ